VKADETTANTITDAMMKAWIPTMGKAQIFPLEMKDDDSVFTERYLRNTPAEIVPHSRNTETGFTESFTIMFKHLYSFTFSLSLS